MACAAGFDVDVRNVVSAPERLHVGYDLLVVGAPTHAFSLSRHKTRADAVKQGAPSERTRIGMRDWLKDLSWDGSPPAVAVFDTRATKVRHLRWAADRTMISLLRRLGLRPTARRASSSSPTSRGPWSRTRSPARLRGHGVSPRRCRWHLVTRAPDPADSAGKHRRGDISDPSREVVRSAPRPSDCLRTSSVGEGVSLGHARGRGAVQPQSPSATPAP